MDCALSLKSLFKDNGKKIFFLKNAIGKDSTRKSTNLAAKTN